MPSEPTQDTIDQIQPYLDAEGIPQSLAAAVFQALDAAGWTVVEKEGGAPVTSIDTTPAERVAIEGMPGVFLVAVEVGNRGWLVWREVSSPGGTLTRSEPLFLDGPGVLLSGPP